MGFPGFKSSQDAADTIAYLRSLSDAPVALPQPNK
jgi:cytochrome c2